MLILFTKQEGPILLLKVINLSKSIVESDSEGEPKSDAQKEMTREKSRAAKVSYT